jgi:hypothetical protein
MALDLLDRGRKPIFLGLNFLSEDSIEPQLRHLQVGQLLQSQW